MRWLNEYTIIYSFVFTGKSLTMKEQIQHDDDDDDTQIYIYKTLTDTAMMVRFFLSPQGFNFSDIYIHTHLQNTLSGDENNFGPVRICFKCKLPNMLIQQLHT